MTHRVVTAAESFAAGATILPESEARHDLVEVVDYDLEWAARYEQVRRQLAAALGATAVRIEHVGSTAVVGLAAKPIVDVQVSVHDVEDEDMYVPALDSLGYPLRMREAGHRYFRPRPGLPRLAQIHVCNSESEWERNHLLFRDYLRAHPQVAIQYGVLKRALVERHREDRIAYTDAKGPFIVEQLNSAEGWAATTGWRH